ncbi:MAG: sigma-70 family RNA polymerase sigma factor [Candidatus Poribacteria bacterium]|nr:sigma-70 family RNA polymerase sigma factor [Candidatus Poribacteria bacterium]
MEDNIVQLIHRILTGEEEAFSILVQKYQKRIHALAWRKIGDYHIAQEITQDTFIQVYNNLSKLKNPKLFDGWVYVIVNRLCSNWLQRNKDTMPFLEDIPIEERNRTYHTQYQSEQRTTEIREHYREVVKKLLEKLPESERTVIILYYLSEMSVKDIGNFLGVSANTIKSRLHRARNRLEAEEHLLISEAFGSLQLSTDLTESIMKQIADIKPTPQVAKPLLPWIALSTAAVLVILLLGAMSQRLGFIQKPYDFNAQSEPTIEIVESPIHLDTVSKPALHNQVGKSILDGNVDNDESQVSEAVLVNNARENATHLSSVWKQTYVPQGDPVYNLFSTSNGNLYAFSWTGVYKLSKGTTSWRNISANIPTSIIGAPIAEYQDTLYVVGSDNIYTSTDDSISWQVFSPRPIGKPIGLVIRDKTSERKSRTNFIMYIAMRDKGVFRSTDAGKKWIPLNDRLNNKKITAVAAMGNAVFIGTNQGLFRLISDDLERLSVGDDTDNAVHALAVDENDLYVATGQDFLTNDLSDTKNRGARKIFHSTNLGMTWTDITPKDKYFMIGTSPASPTRIMAKGSTLFVLGVPTFQSTDAGQTWTNLGFDTKSSPSAHATVIAIDENTFYKLDKFSIHRTVDSGKTWHSFMDGIVGTDVQELISFNNRLYVYTGSDIYETMDNEKIWVPVRFDYGQFTSEQLGQSGSFVHHLTDSKFVVVGKSLYLISSQGEDLDIFRLRIGEAAFSLVQRISSRELWKNAKSSTTLLSEGIQDIVFTENNTIFIPYKNRLLKWDTDSLIFTDTGLIDTNKHPDHEMDNGFKVAALSQTVYVGKRDGKLFQSINGGESWRDITLSLPSTFTHIKDIVFANMKVYVATDKGVLCSQTGEYWRPLTDNVGTHIVIDKLAVNGLSLYGVGDMGIYRLDSDSKWNQFSSSIPDKVLSVAVSSDKLYIATKQHGIFHILLEEKPLNVGDVISSRSTN